MLMGGGCCSAYLPPESVVSRGLHCAFHNLYSVYTDVCAISLMTAYIDQRLGMGFPVFLRTSLDDTSASVQVASIWCLHAMLVYPGDEAFADTRAGHVCGLELPPLGPLKKAPLTGDEADAADAAKHQGNSAEKDVEATTDDLVTGMVGMSLLERFRYLFEVQKLEAVYG